MKIATKIAIGVIVAIVGIWICFKIFDSSSEESVDSYRQKVIAAVNQDLMNPDSAARRRVESAHMTVTAKRAYVSSCIVQTVDGSNRVGKNGNNISGINVVITVIWDGWIHKDGFTELQIEYNPQTQARSTRFLRSNAVFNWETVDWSSVGYTVGYIAGALL